MTTVPKNAVNIIGSLSGRKLKEAYYYLQYLKDKDEWESTQELLDNNILNEINEGIKQIQQGKFTYLKDIRRELN